MARRPNSPLAPLALVLALGLAALAGCGASKHLSSPQRAVKTAAAAYLRALSHGDYTGACALLTSGAAAHVANRAHRLRITALTCPGQLAGIVGAMDAPLRQQVVGVARGATVGAVRVTGSHASAEVDASFRGQRHAYGLPLRLERAAWKIDARTSPSEG